jgi:hypothetical protein
VDVRIGVTYSAREIDLELPTETDREALKDKIAAALSEDDKVLWLTDTHGRDVGIASAKLAYVDLGSSDHERRIGFASG